MTELFVVITGNVQEQLGKLEQAISPTSLEMFLREEADPYIRKRTKERFNQEGDDVTGKWTALSPATVLIRERLGYGGGHPINVRSGDLEAFLTQQASALYLEQNGAYLEYPGSQPSGTLGRKFKGAQQGEGRAPARPVVGMGEPDLQSVQTALESYIVGAVG